MKYIKTYENKKQNIYLINDIDNLFEYELFNSEKSAINWLINKMYNMHNEDNLKLKELNNTNFEKMDFYEIATLHNDLIGGNNAPNALQIDVVNLNENEIEDWILKEREKFNLNKESEKFNL